MTRVDINMPGSGRMGRRLLLRGLLLIGSLVALACLVKASHLSSLLGTSWVDQQVRGKGLDGKLLFIGIGALATAVGVPRQLVGFLGGYAFGFLGGTLWALAATVGGCVVDFYYARWLGRPLIKARFEQRIRGLDDFIRDNPFSMTMLIRLLPVGNNLVTSLTAGVSSVPAWAFFLGSAIGYIPQTAVFALGGSGVNVDPVLRIGLATVLFPVCALIGVNLYRRFRRGRSFNHGIDQELGRLGNNAGGA